MKLGGPKFRRRMRTGGLGSGQRRLRGGAGQIRWGLGDVANAINDHVIQPVGKGLGEWAAAGFRHHIPSERVGGERLDMDLYAR